MLHTVRVREQALHLAARREQDGVKGGDGDQRRRQALEKASGPMVAQHLPRCIQRPRVLARLALQLHLQLGAAAP